MADRGVRRRSFLRSGQRGRSLHNLRRLGLETLESRWLLSVTFTVTNIDDSGSGSLRQTLLDANANPGTDTIGFNIPGDGPHTLRPLSALPAITDPVIIDGYTQFGASPNSSPIGDGFNTVLKIELDGSLTRGASGLVITAGDSVVRGLVINSFSENGVFLQAKGGNTLEGNFIGTDLLGLSSKANGGHGVQIRDGSQSNVIGTDGDGQGDLAEGNVISGNLRHGVQMWGSGSAYNVVAGNFIGTAATGLLAVKNGWSGVNVSGGANANRIGTDGDGRGDLAERNLLSGNGWDGVKIEDPGSDNNVVAGNFIGTDVTGVKPLANYWQGVLIWNGVGNRVGTNSDGTADTLERNVISGNRANGVLIGLAGAEHNVVAGNFIGTDVTGTLAVGNGNHGVWVYDGGQDNFIGTNGDGQADAAERNIISGNQQHGVLISARTFPNLGLETTHNVVAGNFIGTDVTGLLAVGNGWSGVDVAGGANANRIGTDGNGAGDLAERNLLSANGWDGVKIEDLGSDNNIVAGNFIGTNITGTAPLANVWQGVLIWNSAGNRIGTNGDGTADALERNVISGNLGWGVFIFEAASNSNVVAGNFIGTDITGASGLGNGFGYASTGGVGILSATSNRIGGSGPAGNTIAFNAGVGVAVAGDSVDNPIQGNSIHSNGGLGIDLGNDGVTVSDPDDTDVGPNQLQNFPAIWAVQAEVTTTVVVGSLDSRPGTAFTLDFYASPTLDPSGYGEGQRWLGSYSVSTNASGHANFDVELAAALGPGEFVTATATDSAWNTSEFSAPNRVPTANAGGPYAVAVSGSLTLDASCSSDPDQPASTLDYTWDLDGDGVFGETGANALHGDEQGPSPTFFAPGEAGSATVRLRVTDAGGLAAENSAVVRIVADWDIFRVMPADWSADGVVRLIRVGSQLHAWNAASVDLIPPREFSQVTAVEVIGRSGTDDTLILDVSGGGVLPGASVNTFAGDTGNDRLLGGNQVNSWVLDGTDAGTLNGRLRFTGVENLTGGAAVDSFELQTGSLSGVLSDAGGPVTKTGAGTFTLGAANTYTGPTTVNEGILAVNGANTERGRIAAASAVTINAGGKLSVDAYNALGGWNADMVPTVTINAGGVLALAEGLSAHLNRVVLNGGELASANPDSNWGGWTLDGVIIVTGSGVSTISARGIAPSRWDGVTFDVAADATLNVSGTLTASGNGFLGTQRVIKTGTGTMILGGANSFPGGTTVNGGTLLVNSPGGAGTGPVTVNRGAVLGGAGTITGPVTINSGATVAPGSLRTGTGTLGTGVLTLASGATYEVQWGGIAPGQADQIAVAGTVNLAEATINVSLAPGYTPQSGDHIKLLDNDGSDAISGTLAGLPEGTLVAIPGVPLPFYLTYRGGDGNDVVLVQVDNIPPTVTGTSPSLEAGTLVAGATTLQINFSESVVGADGAANYQLQNLGPDSLLGTADDTFVPLTVSSADTTATLTFSGLSPSVYRLTVRASLTDRAGNALDGNGDGTAGDAYAADFVVAPAGDGALFDGMPVFYTGGSGRPDIATGQYIATGDFNRDGLLDLAVVNHGTNASNLGILLNRGHGLFADVMTDTNLGVNFAAAVASGDFNGDGILDLVTCSDWYTTDNLYVNLGRGDGTFDLGAILSSGGARASSLATGDFNGDGSLDLAVANYDTANVSVLLGSGDGGFGAAVLFASGGSGPRSITTGDFNGDGRPDLAVANSISRNLAILLGQGDGTFAAAVATLSGGYSPVSLATGDFNGDGYLDLAVANYGSATVSMFSGDGGGGLSDPATFDAGGSSPVSLAADDFNGDGRLDLAVACQWGRNVNLLAGNSDGTFADAIAVGSSAVALDSVRAGDFDGDGLLDLAVAGDSTVGLLMAKEGGTFAATPTAPSGGNQPCSVSVADFNGDGHLDLAVANHHGSDWGSPAFGIALGNGDGTFGPVATRIFGSDAVTAAVADLNRDGNLDLAVSQWTLGTLGVVFGDGYGEFANVQQVSTGAPNGASVPSLVTGDFNGDGIPDLAATYYGDGGGIGVFLGHVEGDGRFWLGGALSTSTGATPPRPSALVTGEFNGDGRLDLAVIDAFDGMVSLLLGDGDGTFTPTERVVSGTAYSGSVTASDLNGDGKLDLAVGNGFGPRVGLLFGNGDGTFAPYVPLSTQSLGCYFPESVTAGDFNGDGRADLAVSDRRTGTWVFLGLGDGTFAPTAMVGAGGPVVASGDFNGDGRLDLAVANINSNSVFVLLNRDTLAPVVLYSAGGLRLDIQTGGFMAGQLLQGPSNAFDGLNRLQVGGNDFAPISADPVLDDGGRTVVTGKQALAGLNVHREITVPDTGLEDFARTVDVFENPTGNSITTTVRIVGNLGSDSATAVFATSDGDADVEPTDQWIGTDDATDGGGTPAIVHYLHGPQGLVPLSLIRTGDNLEWTYNLTVPAGQTVRLAHFTIMAATRAQALAEAGALVTAGGFGGEAATFLSRTELDSVANFVFVVPTTLAFQPGSGVGTYGESASLTATLTADAGPLPNASVVFSLNGSSVGTAITDANGVASLTGVSLAGLHAGSYIGYVAASFFGDTAHSANAATADLTVNARALTVTADAQTRTYGTADPALTYQLTAGSLVNGDSLAGSLSRVPGEDVGTYAIQQGTLALDSNYVLSYAGAALSITKADQTITWSDPQAIVYGTPLGAAQLNATVAGVLDGSPLGGLTYSPAVGTALHAGAAQELTVTAAGTQNYNPATKTVYIDVDKALLTVTADNKNKVFGAADPPLTYTPSGTLYNGDSYSVISGVSLSTATGAAATVGTHPIYATGGLAADYDILNVNGTLTVIVDPGQGILLLDPTGKGALTVSGNGGVTVSGGKIVVNSGSAQAVKLTGNGGLSATEIDTKGVSISGKGTVQGVIDTADAPLADPLASLTAPSVPATVRSSSTLNIAGGQVTLQPGLYVGGIKISGQAQVMLAPGIYYLQGGGFSVSGQATVTGVNVMLYNAPGKASDTISFATQGDINLTGPSGGAYQGIAIFQDRTSTAALSLTGQGNLNIVGSIYAASATLKVTGNGSLRMTGNAQKRIADHLIVADLQVTGNGGVLVDVSGNAPLLSAVDYFFANF